MLTETMLFRVTSQYWGNLDVLAFTYADAQRAWKKECFDATMDEGANEPDRIEVLSRNLYEVSR